MARASILVSAEDDHKQEQRLIGTDYEYGPWEVGETPGSVRRYRFRQHRYEVLFFREN